MINKRPLYFISGEDFYFLAYSILLVLELLGGSSFRLKDHRKLGFLIQFVSDERLVGILNRYMDKTIQNPVDRELLFASFTQAELHKSEIFKILFSLEKRGFIEIRRTDTAEILDISLVKRNLNENFFKNELFDKERKNAANLKSLIPRISTLTFESLLGRLYIERGVRIWAS